MACVIGVATANKFDDTSSEETHCLLAGLWRESRGMSWADLEDTPVAPVKQMFVKSLTSRTVGVHARVADTAGVICTQVAHKLGVPVMFQRLIFEGKQVDHDRVLGSYGVRQHSNLACRDGCCKSNTVLWCRLQIGRE